MQIGQDHQLIEGQLLIIVCLLEKILYRGKVRSKMWFRDRKSESQAIADTTCELVWIHDLLN